ncbi:ran-interacting mog1 protein [Phlyctema vagabunda]|uniref:Ran-interacting mog1 protein n=1 Tax=Phlyctema vagabunda TaxID=108571 RepID=A0ABR4PTE3_9HELO
MTTSYSSTPLFGGALIVDLPSTFADVSQMRQVPDHQEVFIDKDGFTSIIFDITERVGTSGTGAAIDGAAMTTHLEDIVDSDIDTVKVWSTSNTQFSKLPEGTPAYTLIATQTPPPDPEKRHLAPDFTAIVLNLIRLEDEKTDILITINVPHIKGEYTEEEVNLQLGMQGKLIEDAVECAARIWETFKIKDWALFNEV